MGTAAFRVGAEAGAGDLRPICAGFQAGCGGARARAVGGCRAPVSRRRATAAGMERGLVVPRHDALRPGPVRRGPRGPAAVYGSRSESSRWLGVSWAVRV